MKGRLLVAFLSLCGIVSACSPHVQRPTFFTPSSRDLAASPAAQRLRSGVAGANLIIILLDAARADHFTSFGYAKDTTPQLAKMFDQCVLFTEAYAAGACTKPSVTSLFTSQFPDTHGTLSTQYAMTSEGATLAECFRAAGYTTVAFSGSPAVANCFGFNRGFGATVEVFREAGLRPADGRNAGSEVVDGAWVLESVSTWMGTHKKEPFFAYIHFREPHGPYNTSRRAASGPPRPMSRANLYDDSLTYVDGMVGKLLQTLDAQGVLQHSVVVVLADHGEALGEHGAQGHSKTAYREVAHVPVAIRFPAACGVTSQRRSDVFSLTDLMPTLLDAFHLPFPQTMQGRSRLALFTGERDSAPAFAVTRAIGEDETGGKDDPRQVVYTWRDARYTLLLADGGRRVELYDRTADPGETRNLADQQSDVVKKLRQQFEAWADTQRGRPVVLSGGSVYTAPNAEDKMDEQTRRQLKALGYLK